MPLAFYGYFARFTRGIMRKEVQNMSVESKDYERLMKMAEDVDPGQFMDFAVRYMRKNNTQKQCYMNSLEDKSVEIVRIARKLQSDDKKP